MYVYCAIAFGFLAHFITGMFLARKLLRNARAVSCTGAHESDLVAVPVTLGWLRPRILLPMEWREWDSDKLDAVLAHEGAGSVLKVR
jgi:hypothetical protein